MKQATGFVLLATVAMMGSVWVEGAFAADDGAIDVGARRELFVDASLIQSLDGEARQVLHHPTPREIVLVCDRPWEGNGLNYITVFRDGDVYKMYYRGGDYDRGCDPTHEQVYCYAESRDGVEWTRPNLGLVEFAGSKENNILLTEKDKELGYICHNFSPFLDTNPASPAAERYKAIGGGPLFALVSPDGLRWKKASATPIVTVGDFDSHNLAFWDAVRGEYRAYHRKSRDGRDIMTETSKTFFDGWSEPVFLEYTPSRGGELYTNQVTPYYRAPHYYLGFPTRYEDRGLTPSTRHLPQWDYRQQRSAKSPREGTAVTEGLFMASRDGLRFQMFQEAFIRPGLRTADSWFYGDMYQNNGLVETRSSLAPDAPNELSMYVTEGTLQNGKPAKLRRYTLRLDGFVSVGATMPGGKLVTKPIRFSGKRLTLNLSSSARGGVRVGLLDASGAAIPGHSLDECPWIYGDAIDRPVEWTRDKGVTDDVSAAAGKPVRMVVELKDADLYSFKFE
ncbi:MAG: hypothetical protein NTW96_16155 [Planctomycetia bacterium]|nr:hypothetical protein [Planctomycetia bacterium]